LLLDARGFADSVGHQADQALGKLRHFLDQVGKLRRGKSQGPTVGDRARADCELLHPGERKPSSHLPGFISNHDRLAAQFAPA
jgi:hypothetical protein